MELVLEQTQLGTSYEVSVSAEGIEEFKRKVKIKGEKKESLLTLRQKPERFYTSAGNPVKEILLKLNLPDHRILKDRHGDDLDIIDSLIVSATPNKPENEATSTKLPAITPLDLESQTDENTLFSASSVGYRCRLFLCRLQKRSPGTSSCSPLVLSWLSCKPYPQHTYSLSTAFTKLFSSLLCQSSTKMPKFLLLYALFLAAIISCSPRFFSLSLGVPSIPPDKAQNRKRASDEDPRSECSKTKRKLVDIQAVEDPGSECLKTKGNIVQAKIEKHE
ncbi:hypothetical protein Tco_0802695 [Tanacetum coccineum]|uniref:Uncharacterized protein n=1 Tax=Tanacetum coccineum TaxID=301880 RepID=A0ABQ5A3M7_9ASTR